MSRPAPSQLSDYAFTPWRDDGAFRYYRGTFQETQNVLAIAPALPQQGTDVARLLKNAFELRAQLDVDWATRPLHFFDEAIPPLLTTSDPGGQPLDRSSFENSNPRAALRAALGIVRALGNLHRAGFVHGDVRPNNVLVDARAGRAWLSGFWCTAPPSKAKISATAPRFPTCSLAYVAPERTGHMSGPVDARSDLYSFGVLLYELLSGRQPFAADGAAEWTHAHVARPPTPLARVAPHIPQVVHDLVMALLAKNSAERYQSASEVETDLENCLARWNEARQIVPFRLGQGDDRPQSPVPRRLVGRVEALAALVEAFRRVAESGSCEWVLVAGPSGIGKSALVSSLREALPSPHAFVSGKFDQRKRSSPYAPLAEALLARVRSIRSTSEAELALWSNRLREALGAQAQLMVDFVPELGRILGPQRPVADLPPQAAKRRFECILARLVCAFSRPELPLVLFLDDLQWVDRETKEFLQVLGSDTEIRHLYLIGAYRRDDELTHPLAEAVAVARDAGKGVTQLTLRALPRADVRELVEEALGARTPQTEQLADLLHEKARGNPFFTLQHVTKLFQDGLLRFDGANRRWTFDLESIRNQHLTDDVSELLLERSRHLPSATTTVLSTLACLGGSASLSDLAIALDAREDPLKTALGDAAERGFLRLEDGKYAFVHDRIQEASYALLPPDTRRATHLELARRLFGQLAADENDPRIFDVADQFNRAAGAWVSSEERALAAGLNLRAGRCARARAAPAAAFSYLRAGQDLLTPVDWKKRYALAFALGREQAECALSCGDLDAAQSLARTLRPVARNKLDQAAMRRVEIVLYVRRSEYTRAVEHTVEALIPFGIELSPHPNGEEIDVAHATLRRELGSRSIEQLIDLPLVQDQETDMAMSILAELLAPACFTDEKLAFLHLCKMVALTLERGLTQASTHAFAWFGVMLGHFCGEYDEGRRYVELARRLVERHGFAVYEAKTLFSLELALLWTAPLSDAVAAIRAAYRAGNEGGDTLVSCFARHHIVSDRLVRGDTLEDILGEAEASLSFVERVGSRDVIDVVVVQRRFIRTLMDRTPRFGSFDGKGFAETGFESSLTQERMPTMVFWYWVFKAQARYLAGRYDEAWMALERARGLRWSSPMHIQYLNYHLFSALTLLAQAQNDKAIASGGEFDARLSEHRRQLEHWANTFAPTFFDKLALVDAEIARHAGDLVTALKKYEAAIAHAKEQSFTPYEALGHELAAGFHRSQGWTTSAQAHLEAARDAYARWGAAGKVRQLEQAHPELPLSPSAGSGSGESSPLSGLELSNVVQALQVVSREIVLDRLIEAVMQNALWTAGADRGLLVMTSADGTHSVDAEASFKEGKLSVKRPGARSSGHDLAEPLLKYVLRTRQPVIINDTSVPHPLLDAAPARVPGPRSILCVPLAHQARLAGVLWLENSLATDVFTARRVAFLDLLASQAAISLENARLYHALALENHERTKAESLLAGEKELLEMIARDCPLQETLDALCRLVERSLGDRLCAVMLFDPTSGCLQPRAVPSLPASFVEGHLAAKTSPPGTFGPCGTALREHNCIAIPDIHLEHRWPHFRSLALSHGLKSVWSWPIGPPEAFLATFAVYGRKRGSPTQSDHRFIDQVTHIASIAIERARSEDALHQLRSELAHLARVATVGELTASVAHEVNQPLSGIRLNASSCVRWLDHEPPNLEQAREASRRVVRDAKRAGETISRLRNLFQKEGTPREPLDLEALIREVIALAEPEARRQGVSLTSESAPLLPNPRGDRVQIQQVLLNLILNAIEAVTRVFERPKQVIVHCAGTPHDGVQVSVADSGVGLDPRYADAERLFDPFVTTKKSGMGMGLSISRTIVEAHEGKIWAEVGEHQGMTFFFTLPSAERRP